MAGPGPESTAFQPIGGPLHGLGVRLGLISGEFDSSRIGLVLGWGLWLVLALVAIATGVRFFSASFFDVHVRLLLGIPLFFLAEAVLLPRMQQFVGDLARSRMVPAEARQTLASAIAMANRFSTSPLPDTLSLIAAVLLSAFGPSIQFGTHSAFDTLNSVESLIAGVGTWCWLISLTLVRFLILRWLWRILVWIYLLLRISRLPLNLLSSHHDNTGGLGFLLVTQAHFVPLVIANSTIVSGGLAQQLAADQMTLPQTLPLILIMVLINAVVVLGPLLAFTPMLVRTFIGGFRRYSWLSETIAGAFERKWLDESASNGEELLERGDVSAHSDLAALMGIVTGMRLTPISIRLTIQIVGASLLPFLPLALFKYRLVQLVQQVFLNFVGF